MEANNIMQNQFGNMRLIKLGDEWQLGNWRFMVSSNSILTDEQQIAKKVAETIKNFPDPTKIPEKAFCSNTADMLVDKLTQIIIPSSVTSIGDSAFSGHGNLTQIIIPNSVESIGNNAFFHCENLGEITIPSSVTYIGNGVFDYCHKLKEIRMSESLLNAIIRKKLGLNSNVKILDLDGRELVSLVTKVPPQASRPREPR